MTACNNSNPTTSTSLSKPNESNNVIIDGIYEIYPITNYEDSISPSEFIVYGTVNNITSHLENSSISSTLEIKIKGVLKGDIKSKKISVNSDGGVVSYNEFFEDTKGKLKGILSEEDFEKEENEAKNNKTKKVESVANGRRLSKVNDNVLLFLQTDVSNGKLVITGSFLNGLFMWNDKNNTFYRESADQSYYGEVVDTSDSGQGTEALQEMLISLDELKEKIRITKDTSEEVKDIYKENIKKTDKEKAFDKSCE